MTTTQSYCDADFATLAAELQNASCQAEIGTVVGSGPPPRRGSSPQFENIAALAIIGVVGVLSNIAVLAVLFKKENRKLATNRYLINIAISDILMSCFVTVRILEKLDVDIWSAASCHVYVVVRYLPLYLGINTILLVAVERFVAIVYPTHFRAFVAPGRVRRHLAVAWLVTLVELIYPAVVVKELPIGDLKFCTVYYTPRHYAYMSVTAIVLPTVLMLASYGSIVGVIFHRQRKLNVAVAPDPLGGNIAGPTTLQKQQTARRQRRAVRVAVTCAVVTILFLACWLPVWITAFLLVFRITKVGKDALNWTIVIIYLHTCMNPVVYFVTDERFRSVFLRIVCRKGIVPLPTTNTISSTHQ